MEKFLRTYFFNEVQPEIFIDDKYPEERKLYVNLEVTLMKTQFISTGSSPDFSRSQGALVRVKSDMSPDTGRNSKSRHRPTSASSHKASSRSLAK